MSSEEELPLRVGGLGYARREHLTERCSGGRWWTGAAASADDGDHRAAIADVVVQLLKRRVATGLLAEVALHPNERVPRPEVCRKRIARLPELARYRRNEDPEFARPHRPSPKARS